MRRLYFAVPCLLLVAAAGDVQHYALDGGASSVSAKVPFLGLTSKTANFPKLSGQATLIARDPSGMALDVTIDARALIASDDVTQSRLRGEKFFWVNKYPAVRFAGKGMEMRDDRRGTISGKLTARGVTQPVTLAVTFADPPAAKLAGDSISLTGTTTIDRRKFGMTSYRMLVGNKVDITIKARMVPD